MLNKLDYSYNNENSIVHNISPCIKIIGLLFYILFSILKYNNYLFIFNLIVVFSLILFSNIDIKRYLKVVWNLKYIIILLYVVLYSNNLVIRDINVIIFKLLFLVLYFKCFLFTTTREEIGKGGSLILNLFNLIGFSIRRIAINISNLFSFVISYFDTITCYFNNFNIKGGKVDSSLIDKFLLIFKEFKNIWKINIDKYKRRKNDMLNKLYNKNLHISYQYRYKFKIYDYVFVIMYLSMLVFYILKVR